VLSRLPGLSTIIVRDASVCPAGEQYLTWDDFAALGRERLAAAPELVNERLAAITSEDPVTLLYTSGTTGNPKASCSLTTACCTRWPRGTRRHHQAARPLGLVLPLAHIAERMFSIYLPVSTAGHVHFCPDVQQLVKTVGEVTPTAFFGVPGVGEDQGRDPGPAGRRGRPGRRAAVEQAMDIGRRYVESTQYGRTTADELAERSAGPISRSWARSARSSGSAGGRGVQRRRAAAPEVGAFFAGLA